MDSKKFGVLFGAITLVILLVLVNMSFYHISNQKLDKSLTEKLNQYESSVVEIEKFVQDQKEMQTIDKKAEEDMQKQKDKQENKQQPQDFYFFEDIVLEDSLVPDNEDMIISGAFYHPFDRSKVYFSVYDWEVDVQSDKNYITTTTQYYMYDVDQANDEEKPELLHTQINDMIEQEDFSGNLSGFYGSLIGMYIDELGEEYFIISERDVDWSPGGCGYQVTEADEKYYKRVKVDDFSVVKEYEIPEWVLQQSRLKYEKCQQKNNN